MTSDAERPALLGVSSTLAPVPLPRIALATAPVTLLAGIVALVGALSGSTMLALGAITGGTLVSVGSAVANVWHIRRMRLVDERRLYVRFHRNIEATVDGFPCRVTDLSLGGASLVAEMPTPASIGAEVELTLELSTGPTTLRATVRRALERGYSARMGIEFAPRQRDAIVELALALLRSDIEAAESAERQHHGRDRDTRAA